MDFYPGGIWRLRLDKNTNSYYAWYEFVF